ncbi:hypothetical protein SZ55_1391 [Pseudomonas sp. FeS53a]|nr:hypothetical protein SZ55_1391 [Pseudomonas sp. FeS53a]
MRRTRRLTPAGACPGPSPYPARPSAPRQSAAFKSALRSTTMARAKAPSRAASSTLV